MHVTAHRMGIWVEAVAEADGSYVVPGLPEGPVRVTAVAWSDDPEVRLLTGAVEARAGEDVTLSLR